MDIILRQPVDKLGEIGEQLKVANGYARNYLIPKGFAVQANKQNVALLVHEKNLREQQQHKEFKQAEKIANKIRSLSCVLKRQTGDQDKMFGSVTSMDVATFLKENGIEIDRKKIQLDEPIKSLGTHKVPIEVHAEISVELKVKVQKES